MGSTSDLKIMEAAAEFLDQMEVPYEINALSAHRVPEMVAEFAKNAHTRGVKVIIAGAGGAAHLPGVIFKFAPSPGRDPRHYPAAGDRDSDQVVQFDRRLGQHPFHFADACRDTGRYDGAGRGPQRRDPGRSDPGCGRRGADAEIHRFQKRVGPEDRQGEPGARSDQASVQDELGVAAGRPLFRSKYVTGRKSGNVLLSGCLPSFSRTGRPGLIPAVPGIVLVIGDGRFLRPLPDRLPLVLGIDMEVIGVQ